MSLFHSPKTLSPFPPNLVSRIVNVLPALHDTLVMFRHLATTLVCLAWARSIGEGQSQCRHPTRLLGHIEGFGVASPPLRRLPPCICGSCVRFYCRDRGQQSRRTPPCAGTHEQHFKDTNLLGNVGSHPLSPPASHSLRLIPTTRPTLSSHAHRRIATTGGPLDGWQPTKQSGSTRGVTPRPHLYRFHIS